jgi:hypothetical protein
MIQPEDQKWMKMIVNKNEGVYHSNLSFDIGTVTLCVGFVTWSMTCNYATQLIMQLALCIDKS